MRFCCGLLVLPALAGCAISQPVATAPVTASACKADAKWGDPATPRRIHGNTWYVGTCGLSAILITSPQGHVLIDGATDEVAPLIEANVRASGFRLEDVRYILNSHEHFDHAGGIARLQRDSGATVMAREAAAATLERGHSDRTDPQFLTVQPFPPVAGVRRIADGEAVSLGPITLHAHATPGHTPGGTSWSWTSCESRRCMAMVYADSLTPLTDGTYRHSDEGQHPGVLAAFRQTLARVAALPCDILLTPHPAASDLWSRLEPRATAPLINSAACRDYAETAATRLDARLAEEAGAAVS